MKSKKQEIKGMEKLKYEVTQEIGISSTDKQNNKKKIKKS
jgi:hypothetical protein